MIKEKQLKSNTSRKDQPSGAKRDSAVFRSLSGNEYVEIERGAERVGAGKIISLFTGAGGMEIGLEDAGFETAVCVEMNSDCRATLRRNRPDWKLFDDDKDREPGDIRSISAAELLMAAGLKEGEAALVTGGAPCQPFSNIGKKQGKADPKNGDLFLEFVRVVKGVRPKAFIFENVAGITQGRHSEVIEYMREQFFGSGYHVAFDILNAADYGVPQKRKRFIMLGMLGHKPAFPLPTHSANSQSWEKFSSGLLNAPQNEPLPWITSSEALSRLTEERILRSDCLGMNHSDEMIKRMRLIKQGQNFKVLPMSMRPKCWQSGRHQGHDTFGRIEADQPAPTIRTAGYNPTKGKYIHPFENRGLNTAEMAVLQDFPDDWVFTTQSSKPTIVSIGRQIGNAVPPGLAEALGRAIANRM